MLQDHIRTNEGQWEISASKNRCDGTGKSSVVAPSEDAFLQSMSIADWAISAQLADLSRALDKTTLVRAAPWDLETR